MLGLKVLQGGADQWMRRFYSDSRLVQAYNNDIWGYLDDESPSAIIRHPFLVPMRAASFSFFAGLW